MGHLFDSCPADTQNRENRITGTSHLRFSKLRLTGFKSFVDPTELLISDGLTGVVGPNGCEVQSS